MATGSGGAGPGTGGEESIPLSQRLIDNIWLLMALGLLIPIVSYLLWGLLELASVPALR